MRFMWQTSRNTRSLQCWIYDHFWWHSSLHCSEKAVVSFPEELFSSFSLNLVYSSFSRWRTFCDEQWLAVSVPYLMIYLPGKCYKTLIQSFQSLNSGYKQGWMLVDDCMPHSPIRIDEKNNLSFLKMTFGQKRINNPYMPIMWNKFYLHLSIIFQNGCIFRWCRCPIICVNWWYVC